MNSKIYSEPERKSYWLNHLQRINSKWSDGDTSKIAKTVDLENTELKLGIELKLEEGGSLNEAKKNIETFSNRLQTYFKTAGDKFCNYPGWKHLLIIELYSNVKLAKFSLEGITSLHLSNSELIGSSIRNKSVFLQLSRIGSVVFHELHTNDSRGYYFFDNPFANESAKINQSTTELLLNRRLHFLEIGN